MIVRPYKVQSGNNVPIQAPIIPTPVNPYKCENQRSVGVYAIVDPDLIKKYLEPTPFEYVSNIINISITDILNRDLDGGFYDFSFTVPVMYKGKLGGYTMFEYESEDYGIYAGRQLWGYPKEYAKMNVTKSTDRVVATASKWGVEFCRIEFDMNNGDELKTPDIQLSPNLQIHCIPNCDGPGVFIKRVMERNTSPEFKSTFFKVGNATLTLKAGGSNPFDEFASAEILCGTYSEGNFISSAKGGWAKVLEVLVAPEKI